MPVPTSRAVEVLSRYPVVASSPTPLGNHGGFSGASLWRVECPHGSFCLRAWPSSGADRPRIETIHRWMRAARDAGHGFVPAVVEAAPGETVMVHAGRAWDLTQWLPGVADFRDRPSTVRLQAACSALAHLHDVCPALLRRLTCVRDWLDLCRTGWRPRPTPDDPCRPAAELAWALLVGRVLTVPERLSPWTMRRWRLQPCVCDVWHDHLLFEGDRLVGLIDYGAAKIDHPAVDLARLLGSLAPDDPAAWEAGLAAYRRIRPLTADEGDLARALDRTGVVLSAATWLRWLYEERRDYADRTKVALRLEQLAARLQGD
jgi:homoserine kinase type II